MRAFSLLFSIALVSSTFSFPQSWFSRFSSRGTQVASKVPEHGNNAVPLTTGIKSSAVQTGTYTAKTALPTETAGKSNSLPGATNLVGTGLGAGASLANSFGLGQQAIKTGANILKSGLQNGLLTKHMQQEAGKLVNDLSKSASNVAAELNEGKDIVENLKGKVGNIVHELGSLANSDSVKQIRENVDATKKKLENVRNEIESLIVRNSGKPIGERMKAMSASIGNVLGHLGALVAGGTGEQVMSNIGSHVGRAMNEVGTVINDSPLQRITNAISSIKSKLETVVSDLSSTIAEERTHPVGEMIGKVGQKIGTIMSEVGSAVGGNSGKRLLGSLGERISNVMSEVGSTVGDSVHKIRSVANDLEGQLGQAVGQVTSFIGSTNRDDIMQVLRNGPQAALSQYSGVVNAVADVTTGQGITDKIGCALGRILLSQASAVALPLITG